MTDTLTPEDVEFLRGLKRSRRRRWAIGVGIALAVIVIPLLAAYLYDCYWQHKVAVKVAQLRAQGKLLTFPEMLARDSYLPPGQNSALVYLQGFAQLQDTPQGNVAERLCVRWPLGVRPSQATTDLLNSEAAANAQGLKTILSATPLNEGCYPLKPAPSPVEMSFQDCEMCEKVRRAALLCWRVAVLHAAAGHPAGATPYLLAGFGLASSFGHKALLIEGLVRIAVDSVTLNALERSLALCQFTPEDLQKLKDRLNREQKELSLDSGLVYARSAARFTFEYMIGDPRLARDAGAGGLWRVYPIVPGWREKDELLYHEIMDETERIRALPPHQAWAAMEQFGGTVDQRLWSASPPAIVGAMLMPAISRSLRLEVQTKVQLSAAVAALAAEQYRLKNGRWPDSLEQLVPQYLDTVPEDYFGVGEVQYKRTETGVLLYSFGPDGKDEGGVSEEAVDRTAPAGQRDAYDVPFRLLNPELRGAKTMTFREEVVGSGVQMKDLQAAGLDEAALKRLGLTEEDLKKLQ